LANPRIRGRDASTLVQVLIRDVDAEGTDLGRGVAGVLVVASSLTQ
jgi:hypothetical protein